MGKYTGGENEKASNAKTRMACFHPVNSLAVYLKKGSFDGFL